MEEDKNLEQNLDNSNEKLHISDVMCCFCGKLHKKTELIDGNPICETCFNQGYNFDYVNWLTLERIVLK